MENTKILFAGIGGVGGFFGGMLAYHFENNSNVTVSFIARGEHLKEIKTSGLKIVTGETQIIANPSICTDIIADVGIIDFIFICTKTYDLKNISENLGPSIDENTVIITLLNGTNNHKIVQKLYPNNLVLNGCVYIVSRLKNPGLIENSGNIQTLYFGKDNYENEKLNHLEKLLNIAKINANYTNCISQIVWEKFIFLSPIATATTALNKTIGELMQDTSDITFIMGLIDEVKHLAKAKKISLRSDITEITIAKLKSLPYQTTTSMHSDFQLKKSKTELEAITTIVIQEGDKYALKVPNYTYALERILSNINYQ
jgi:2-dehydropantoate 2-reductase